MKKIIVVALVVMVTFVLSSAVFAVGPGKKVDYAGGDQGKVVFSGDTHKANKCNECHPAIFKMKKGSVKIAKADHVAGKLCGTCHDGKKAFGWQEEANCAKCHKK
jgi:c(7)-type cytochrome triheme protein